MSWPTLNSEGFLITEIAGQWTILEAEFGDGFKASSRDGLAEGLRSWSLKLDVLPGDASAAKLAGDFLEPGFVRREGVDPTGYVLAENGGRLILDVALTRAAYLWQFFRASKAAGDRPFWIEFEDPETGTRQTYLANFAEDRLTYTVLCAQVYSTGLELIERRVPAGVSRLENGL